MSERGWGARAARESVEAVQILEVAEKAPAGGTLRISASGENIDGAVVSRTVLLPIGQTGSGAERLAEAGVEVREEGGKVYVDNLVFGSAAEQAGLDFDWEIIEIETEAQRPDKQWMYIPALLVLAGIGRLQTGRRRRADAAAAAEA